MSDHRRSARVLVVFCLGITGCPAPTSPSGQGPEDAGTCQDTLGSSCQGTGSAPCCVLVGSNHTGTVDAVCSGGRCCATTGETCNADSDCCSGSCVNQSCAGCSAVGGGCSTESDCCSGEGCSANLCCAQGGSACTQDGDCCTNSCQNGVCACGQKGGSCAVPVGDCCSGLSCEPPTETSFTATCCFSQGGTCTTAADCCLNSTCDAGICAPPPPASDCQPPAGLCIHDSDCCSGTCFLLLCR